MPLEPIPVPPDVVSAARSHLTRMAQRRGFRTRGLAEALPLTLALAAPHPVFTIGLRTVDGTDPLPRARGTAWRFLVRSGARPVAAAEVVNKKGEAIFSHTNEGPFVEGTVRALEAVEPMDRVRSGNFELALLRVPALYVMALWLRDRSQNGSDLVVPMDPAPAGMPTNRPLSGEEFGALLGELRRIRGESDDDRSN